MNIVVCALARHEWNYINDWVKYYFSIGVSHIYIYDNDDVNEPKYIGDYIQPNLRQKVTIYDIRGLRVKSMQHKVYEKFYREHSFDWCFFIDIDEFLMGVTDVNEWLSSPLYRRVQQVRIQWRLFGDDGLIERDMSVPVYDVFRQQLTAPTSLCIQGKSVVRGHLGGAICRSCHFFSNATGPLPQCLPSGAPCHSKFRIEEDYSRETIFLNHYMTKSLKEFMEQKYGRGDALFMQRNIDLNYYWEINEITPKKIEWLKENYHV